MGKGLHVGIESNRLLVSFKFQKGQISFKARWISVLYFFKPLSDYPERILCPCKNKFLPVFIDCDQTDIHSIRYIVSALGKCFNHQIPGTIKYVFRGTQAKLIHTAIQRVTAHHANHCPRHTMTRTVGYRNEQLAVFFLKPVKITAYNILGTEKEKTLGQEFIHLLGSW